MRTRQERGCKSKAGRCWADLPLQALVSLCLQTGDELLWTEFVRQSQPIIAGVILRTMRRWGRPMSSLVDDLVQETYLKLFANNARALRKFVSHHENAMYGFLKVVASNVAQDHIRCTYSQKRGSGCSEEQLLSADVVDKRETANKTSAITALDAWPGRAAASFNGPDDVMEHGILLSEIDGYLKRRAFAPTFSRDYSIFWLYYKEGLTAKAIAEIRCIGLTIKGVESTLLRLTKLVRQNCNHKLLNSRNSSLCRAQRCLILKNGSAETH